LGLFSASGSVVGSEGASVLSSVCATVELIIADEGSVEEGISLLFLLSCTHKNITEKIRKHTAKKILFINYVSL
jgi:hypothetical protein